MNLTSHDLLLIKAKAVTHPCFTPVGGGGGEKKDKSNKKSQIYSHMDKKMRASENLGRNVSLLLQI